MIFALQIAGCWIAASIIAGAAWSVIRSAVKALDLDDEEHAGPWSVK